jgi:hypothetical protein
MILQTATYNGNTYHLVANNGSERITWADAEAFAVTLGGHLTTVNDASENAWLLSTFSASAEAAKALAHPAPGGLFMWLGLNDIEAEGVFAWAGGDVFNYGSYSNWASGQPQNSVPDEDFVRMIVNSTASYSGEWHDVIYDSTTYNDVTYGIVEVNGIVPAPGAIALLGTAGLMGRRRRN